MCVCVYTRARERGGPVCVRACVCVLLTLGDNKKIPVPSVHTHPTADPPHCTLSLSLSLSLSSSGPLSLSLSSGPLNLCSSRRRPVTTTKMQGAQFAGGLSEGRQPPRRGQRRSLGEKVRPGFVLARRGFFRERSPRHARAPFRCLSPPGPPPSLTCRIRRRRRRRRRKRRSYEGEFKY